jgi:hypothetical protein
VLVPLSVPDGDGGGQFWLGKRENVVPVGVGDCLLFRANKLTHGTTPVAKPRQARLTFNVRMWLREELL